MLRPRLCTSRFGGLLKQLMALLQLSLLLLVLLLMRPDFIEGDPIKDEYFQLPEHGLRDSRLIVFYSPVNELVADDNRAADSFIGRPALAVITLSHCAMSLQPQSQPPFLKVISAPIGTVIRKQKLTAKRPETAVLVMCLPHLQHNGLLVRIYAPSIPHLLDSTYANPTPVDDFGVSLVFDPRHYTFLPTVMSVVHILLKPFQMRSSSGEKVLVKDAYAHVIWPSCHLLVTDRNGTYIPFTAARLSGSTDDESEEEANFDENSLRPSNISRALLYAQNGTIYFKQALYSKMSVAEIMRTPSLPPPDVYCVPWRTMYVRIAKIKQGANITETVNKEYKTLRDEMLSTKVRVLYPFTGYLEQLFPYGIASPEETTVYFDQRFGPPVDPKYWAGDMGNTNKKQMSKLEKVEDQMIKNRLHTKLKHYFYYYDGSDLYQSSNGEVDDDENDEPFEAEFDPTFDERDDFDDGVDLDNITEKDNVADLSEFIKDSLKYGSQIHDETDSENSNGEAETKKDDDDDNDDGEDDDEDDDEEDEDEDELIENEDQAQEDEEEENDEDDEGDENEYDRKKKRAAKRFKRERKNVNEFREQLILPDPKPPMQKVSQHQTNIHGVAARSFEKLLQSESKNTKSQSEQDKWKSNVYTVDFILDVVSCRAYKGLLSECTVSGDCGGIFVTITSHGLEFGLPFTPQLPYDLLHSGGRAAVMKNNQELRWFIGKILGAGARFTSEIDLLSGRMAPKTTVIFPLGTCTRHAGQQSGFLADWMLNNFRAAVYTIAVDKNDDISSQRATTMLLPLYGKIKYSLPRYEWIQVEGNIKKDGFSTIVLPSCELIFMKEAQKSVEPPDDQKKLERSRRQSKETLSYEQGIEKNTNLAEIFERSHLLAPAVNISVDAETGTIFSETFECTPWVSAYFIDAGFISSKATPFPKSAPATILKVYGDEWRKKKFVLELFDDDDTHVVNMFLDSCQLRESATDVTCFVKSADLPSKCMLGFYSSRFMPGVIEFGRQILSNTAKIIFGYCFTNGKRPPLVVHALNLYDNEYLVEDAYSKHEVRFPFKGDLKNNKLHSIGRGSTPQTFVFPLLMPLEININLNNGSNITVLTSTCKYTLVASAPSNRVMEKIIVEFPEKHIIRLRAGRQYFFQCTKAKNQVSLKAYVSKYVSGKDYFTYHFEEPAQITAILDRRQFPILFDNYAFLYIIGESSTSFNRAYSLLKRKCKITPINQLQHSECTGSLETWKCPDIALRHEAETTYLLRRFNPRVRDLTFNQYLNFFACRFENVDEEHPAGTFVFGESVYKQFVQDAEHILACFDTKQRKTWSYVSPNEPEQKAHVTFLFGSFFIQNKKKFKSCSSFGKAVETFLKKAGVNRI